MAESNLSDASDAAQSQVRLEPALVKLLSRRSLAQTLLYIGFQWAVIAACIAAATHFGSYFVLLLCLIVIATRQHALAVLFHDACHFNLCNSRRLNDFLANIFAAFPLSVSVKRYRRSHLAHHRLVNEADDPDIVENTPPTSLLTLGRLMLMDLCFLSFVGNLKRSRKFGVFAIFSETGEGWKTERRLYGAFVLTIAATATLCGVWPQLALYWLVPQFSILQVLARLRGYAEHGGRIGESHELDMSRTVNANPLEKFLFAPGNVHRHLEHHLYPSVPFYNLERLHTAMTVKAGVGPHLSPTLGYFRLTNLRRSTYGEIYLEPAAPSAVVAAE